MEDILERNDVSIPNIILCRSGNASRSEEVDTAELVVGTPDPGCAFWRLLGDLGKLLTGWEGGCIGVPWEGRGTAAAGNGCGYLAEAAGCGRFAVGPRHCFKEVSWSLR